MMVDQRRFRRNICKELLQDRGGSTYAMIAAAIIPMMGFVGTGLDLGRTYMASSKLQSSVDTATLAAVRMEQLYPGTGTTPGPQTVDAVNKYLTGNMPTNYMGTTRTTPTVSVQRVGDEISVQVIVNGTVPTTLMRIFGFQTLPISARATGVAGKSLPTAVEAMLVLDNTGSMHKNGGMTALRSSVKEFLNIVYGDKETRADFGIGMMPYNVIVNVGHLLPSTMLEQVNGFTNVAPSSGYGWKGCVLADPTLFPLSSDYNVIDKDTFDMGKGLPNDPGSSMPLIQPSIYPPILVDSFQDQDNRYRIGRNAAEAEAIANYEPMRKALISVYGEMICSSNGNNAIPIPTKCDGTNKVNPQLLPNYSTWPEPIIYDSTTIPSEANGAIVKSPNYVCPSQAKPVSYSYTKSELNKYIEKENQPLFNIGTWHNQAMTWGYRLLARDDVFTRARPQNKGLRRVMIFMTDGIFDSKDDSAKQNTAYTGYGSYASQKISTDPTRAAHRDATAIRFRKTCQAMKVDGIEIYTITFALKDTDDDKFAREMFKGCSTNANTHFFETTKASDLTLAFKTIAADLVDVHLEK